MAKLKMIYRRPVQAGCPSSERCGIDDQQHQTAPDASGARQALYALLSACRRGRAGTVDERPAGPSSGPAGAVMGCWTARGPARLHGPGQVARRATDVAPGDMPRARARHAAGYGDSPAAQASPEDSCSHPFRQRPSRGCRQGDAAAKRQQAHACCPLSRCRDRRSLPHRRRRRRRTGVRL